MTKTEIGLLNLSFDLERIGYEKKEKELEKFSASRNHSKQDFIY